MGKNNEIHSPQNCTWIASVPHVLPHVKSQFASNSTFDRVLDMTTKRVFALSEQDIFRSPMACGYQELLALG